MAQWDSVLESALTLDHAGKGCWPPAEDMRVHGVGSFLEVLAPGVGLGLACLGKEGPVAVTDARDAAATVKLPAK